MHKGSVTMGWGAGTCVEIIGVPLSHMTYGGDHYTHLLHQALVLFVCGHAYRMAVSL